MEIEATLNDVVQAIVGGGFDCAAALSVFPFHFFCNRNTDAARGVHRRQLL